MDAAEKILDLLFRRIPPERILRRICCQLQGTPLSMSEDREQAVFLQFAETTLHGYSEDEQTLLYCQLEQAVRSRAEQLRCTPSVFLPLVDFGLEVLTTQGDEPLCRSSKVLSWRSAYHLFGQDMIVCAYLACLDARSRAQRTDFAWPAVLRTDNRVLRQVLSAGIAENHFHLTGSTQSFAVAWCSLMNDPASIQDLPENFSSLLQSVASRGPEDNVLPMEERLTIAALVRGILFRSLTGQLDFSSEEAFRQDYLNCFAPASTLTDRVEVLQTMYGVRLPLPDGESICLDYALELPVFQAVKDSPYRALAGERCLLYRCFSACFDESFTSFERLLFYLYLSLKTAFRGEMIQVNRQVGFLNFKNYQDRKDMAWTGPFRWESCRMALNAPLRTEPIRSLEARLTPDWTSRAIIEKVLAYDRGELFARQPCRPVLSPEEPLPDPESAADQFLEEPFFYVLHFPKQRDEELPPSFVLKHRHQALREKVWAQAEALAEALSTSAYLCSRVRGIDGCANEVDCRPEVFAAAFRFLRGFQTTDLNAPSALLPRFRHRLSLTYHAGEDFYDIADGLRAIDEAICFLDYRRGDRIGHALALGVDPQVHYQAKSMHIVLPQQNYLDNLVWLLYRCRALGVCIDPQQYGLMQQEALRLLRNIYGPVMEDNGWSVTLQDYYCSMMLRGDEPCLYQTLSFQEPDDMDEYSRWQTVPDRPGQQLAAYRSSRTVAGLYASYHYNRLVKEEGQKPIRVPVRPEYITVMRQAQDAMQRYLAERGIVIECNPSSNVLIGTFGEYGRHPITRFNNLDLTGSVDSGIPQLHVCINTDDLGVFDTSLEFEYALLYHALSVQVSKNGQPRYDRESILRYLRSVQEMGMQAVFPSCREP
ncbi:MAG: hypothetical protein K2O45_11730 [Oscillospiraceae bacterium]|nr:hypothetical protein [Oscillospiraceae bacterium]